MERKIHSTIAFFYAERERYHQAPENAKSDVDSFIDNDPEKDKLERYT